MQISIDERKFGWLAIIVAAILLRQPLVAAFIPFLVALALAAVLEPLVQRLEARARLPRIVASGLVLFAFVVAGGYLLLLVSTKILSELVQMGSLLQNYRRFPVELVEDLLARWNELNEFIDQRGLPAEVRNNIITAVENLTQTGFALVTQGINLVIGAVGQIPSLIVILIVALLATYFLVKDKERLTASVLSVTPEPAREKAYELGRRIIADLVSFFRGQIVLLLLTTVIVSIGLIMLGVDYWMTLALIAGILDAIPIIGHGFLFFPWAVASWTLGQPVLSLQLIVLYLFTFLIRQVFQPKILGDSIGVHPLAMLVALYAGIQLFGIQGFIVAPVIVIIIKGLIEFRKGG